MAFVGSRLKRTRSSHTRSSIPYLGLGLGLGNPNLNPNPNPSPNPNPTPNHHQAIELRLLLKQSTSNAEGATLFQTLYPAWSHSPTLTLTLTLALTLP